jgi:acetoacetyl-CoA synthetase
MMFQYLVSGLATGATLVLYEGSPLKRPESLWHMVDEFGITIFGVSAKYLEQISKTYPDVGQRHKLDSLRQILSTGSPLPPGLFDFVYANVKQDVVLGSVTGAFIAKGVKGG